MNFLKRTLYFFLNASIINIFYFLLIQIYSNINFFLSGGILEESINDGEFLGYTTSQNILDPINFSIELSFAFAILLLMIHRFKQNEIDRKFFLTKKKLKTNGIFFIVLFLTAVVTSEFLETPNNEELERKIVKMIKSENMIPFPYNYEYRNVLDSTILDEFTVLAKTELEELTFEKIMEIYRSKNKETSSKNCRDGLIHPKPDIGLFDTPREYISLSDENIQNFLKFHEPSGCWEEKPPPREITKAEIEFWCKQRIPRLYKNMSECKKFLRE